MLPRGPLGWCVLLLLAAAHFVLLRAVLGRELDFLFNDAAHRVGPATDFDAYYTAGTQWLAGNGAYGHGPGFGFRYHPLFAAAFGITLCKLAPPVAFGVWVAIHELAFLGTLAFAARLARSRNELLVTAALLVAFTPYYLEAYMGNATFLAASLSMLALFRLWRGDRRGFVVLFCVAICVKPVALAFVPVVVAQGAWRAAALCLGITALAALPFFVADPAGWEQFLRVNFEAIPAPGWVLHGGNQGLHGLLLAVCCHADGIASGELSSFAQLPGPCRLALLALPVVLIVTSGVLTWRLRHDVGACVFLWAATCLLGYKDVWEHSYSLLPFALVWLHAGGSVPRHVLLGCTILLAMPTLFWTYDVALPPGPFDPQHHWSVGVSLLHHATRPLPLLALYVAVARRARRGRPGVLHGQVMAGSGRC